MLDWSKVTGMLDICALYYTTQLVRCAAFSVALLALVMMLRRFICSERTFAKAALWALFLITPFLGKLKLFYENKAVVKMTAWMTDITMSNLWVGRIYLAGILLTAICIFGRRLRLRRKVAAMEAMTIKEHMFE